MTYSAEDYSKIDCSKSISSDELLQFFTSLDAIPGHLESLVEKHPLDIVPFIIRSLHCKQEPSFSSMSSDWLPVESRALEVCRQILASTSTREFLLSIDCVLEELLARCTEHEGVEVTTDVVHFERRIAVLVLLRLDALAQLRSNKKSLFYNEFSALWKKTFAKLSRPCPNFPMIGFFQITSDVTWATLIQDPEAHSFIFSLLENILSLPEDLYPLPNFLRELFTNPSVPLLRKETCEYPLLLASLSPYSPSFRLEDAHRLLRALFQSQLPIFWRHALFFLKHNSPIDLEPILYPLAECISTLCWEPKLREKLFGDVWVPWLVSLSPEQFESVLNTLLLQCPFWNLIHACTKFVTRLTRPGEILVALTQRLRAQGANNAEAQRIWDAVFLTTIQCKSRLAPRELQYIATYGELCGKNDLLAQYHLEQLRDYVSTL